MIELKAYNTEINVQRLLAKKYIGENAPTLVLLAGIHGNEVSGLLAIRNVWEEIQKQEIEFSGNFYALAGNIAAIQKNIRYQSHDLNRLWTSDYIDRLHKNNPTNPEEKEQLELYTILKDILGSHTGEFFFIDLHTTSSPTTPFLTISDSINNRRFSSNFPVPIVLGIEEYIHGPLLTYVNEFGHIGIGFEAGQHQDKNAVTVNEAFIWMCLVHTDCIKKEQLKDYKTHQETLAAYSNLSGQFFEIEYRHIIKESDHFQMNEGFQNFQKINKNEKLAINNGKTLYSNFQGRIFMPLYQEQGEDGYFIISKISKFWLRFSRFARKWHLHSLLRLLPGIKQSKSSKYTLVINPKQAKYYTSEIFHLFGYRRKTSHNGMLYFTKRDREVSVFH